MKDKESYKMIPSKAPKLLGTFPNSTWPEKVQTMMSQYKNIMVSTEDNT
jgi:hypothetical protein